MFSAVQVVLRLRTRKNKGASVLTRSCWCKQCKSTCPVHVLGDFFESLPVGNAPFQNIVCWKANITLRAACAEQKLKKANMFKCHDFRRGHTKDLQLAGATLRQILEAGEWSSPRFLKYMDMNQLDKDVVISAHLEESSDEDAAD